MAAGDNAIILVETVDRRSVDIVHGQRVAIFPVKIN